MKFWINQLLIFSTSWNLHKLTYFRAQKSCLSPKGQNKLKNMVKLLEKVQSGSWDGNFLAFHCTQEIGSLWVNCLVYLIHLVFVSWWGCIPIVSKYIYTSNVLKIKWRQYYLQEFIINGHITVIQDVATCNHSGIVMMLRGRNDSRILWHSWF
jgi:hypothetical protein